jgi:hypothetical protein
MEKSELKWRSLTAICCIFGMLVVVGVHHAGLSKQNTLSSLQPQRRIQITTEGTRKVGETTALRNADTVSSTPTSQRSLQELSVKTLWTQFEKARNKHYDQMRVDYGKEYFDAMFFQDFLENNGTKVTRIPRRAIIGANEDGHSHHRLTRRLLIKLIQAYQQSGSDKKKPISFVWAVSTYCIRVLMRRLCDTGSRDLSNVKELPNLVQLVRYILT